MEDDRSCRTAKARGRYFNPRPPCGGRHTPHRPPSGNSHFNPRPPCGGRLGVRVDLTLFSPISIHVPRVEDDLRIYEEIAVFGISIHVPRVEDDVGSTDSPFLRTYFNPRPPCGGRHRAININGTPRGFQSTSPVWRTTHGQGTR